MIGNYLLEKDLVPDSLIKWKIKDIIKQRLKDEIYFLTILFIDKMYKKFFLFK